MAKKKTVLNTKPAEKRIRMQKKVTEDEVVVWLRLPQPVSLKKLSNKGLSGALCYGGNTCIAAPDFTTARKHNSDLIVEYSNKKLKNPDFVEMLRKAGFLHAGDCYGGNTCIC